MPITLVRARSDVRNMVADPTRGLLSDQEIDDWLSLGQRHVAALTLCYQRRTVLQNADSPQGLVAGLREYAFSGTFGSGGLNISTAIRVLHVYLRGNSLPLWTAEMVAHADARSTQGGTPGFWYSFGSRLGFVPYPSRAFLATTWTLEIIYADLPTEWTSGPSVLPNGFDDLTTYFALTRILISRRQWAQAGQAYLAYMSLVLEYRRMSMARLATSKHGVQQPARSERFDEPERVVSIRARG